MGLRIHGDITPCHWDNLPFWRSPQALNNQETRRGEGDRKNVLHRSIESEIPNMLISNNALQQKLILVLNTVSTHDVGILYVPRTRRFCWISVFEGF
jgi:hypothetical protein